MIVRNEDVGPHCIIHEQSLAVPVGLGDTFTYDTSNKTSVSGFGHIISVTPYAAGTEYVNNYLCVVMHHSDWDSVVSQYFQIIMRRC